MLYLGHFSFSELWPSPDGLPWHGLFTCVVEATSIDAAFGKFQRLIRDLAKRHDAFENVAEIYLDTCVELHALPAEGLMSFISIREGEDIGGITAALLGAKPRAGVAYQAGRETDEGVDESLPVEPFIRLKRRKRPGKRVTQVPTVPTNRTIH